MKSPDDFGAAGGNESPAVQAWANYCVAEREDGYLPRMYAVDSDLSLPDNLTAHGDGPHCGFAPGPTAIIYANVNLYLRNACFDLAKLPIARMNAVLEMMGGGGALERVYLRNGAPGTLCIAVHGDGNEFVDIDGENVSRGIWDGAVGSQYSRPAFRHTTASPFSLAGSKTRIARGSMADIGENVVMADVTCSDCTIDGMKVDGVIRREGGDNGTAFELHGANWTFDNVEVRNVDWSIAQLFEPVGFRSRGCHLFDAGRGSVRPGGYPETGNDTSAGFTLYVRSKAYGRPPPRDIIVSDFVISDRTPGNSNAFKIMAYDDSDQVTDLYIGAGAMPGQWKGGPIDVRKATTDGVLRSVCGERCYHGNNSLA